MTMDTQHYVLDLYVADGVQLDLQAVVGHFHRWIAERVIDDVSIDVADYAHVLRGPGVLLIGHSVDVSLDLTEGRQRLRLRTKRARQQLEPALLLLLELAARLEAEAGVSFDAGALDVLINDRLRAPNTTSTFQAFRPQLERTFSGVYGAAVDLAHRPDPRARFSVTVRSGSPPALAAMAERLAPGAPKKRRALPMLA